MWISQGLRIQMSAYYTEYVKTKASNRKMERKIYEVKIRGTKTIGMPMWMINNYIKSTCDNYAKLVYIVNIIDIFSNEELDIIDIGISTASPLIGTDGVEFENKLIDFVRASKADKNNEKYCLMSYMPKEGEKGFDHYFNYCERPICFAITRDNDVILLYDPRGNEGIKVCDISYHSPIDIGLGGIGECIEHLVNAGAKARNDKRLQDEHEAKMITQAMQTMGEAINVESKLQNANLPRSHKEYLQNMYDALMAKQEKLNETIGIHSPGIDVRT